MHFILNLAQTASNTLLQIENELTNDGPSGIGSGHISGFHPVKGEASSVRAICIVSKAFHHLGNERSGKVGEFKSFLDAKEKKLLVQDFQGNREYVIFPNATALVFHRHDISEFVCSIKDPNCLLASVVADVSSPVVISGC